MSCRTDRLQDRGLERRLIEHVPGCGVLLRVLSAAEEMDFPDWYVVAGALAQSVWNTTLGHPVRHRASGP